MLSDARWRCQERGAVQLCELRSAGAIGSSVAADPEDCGRGEPQAPGRNGERDFHGEKRSNETHASTTDPDARLYRKGPGQPAKLAYLGHVLMENRHALVVDTRLTLAT